VGQFHVNSLGAALWIDHTLNVNFKLTHYRTRRLQRRERRRRAARGDGVTITGAVDGY
jgi:hypothetical protein